jgi:vacuolar-type H+-ATPase subunit F/Vma7
MRRPTEETAPLRLRFNSWIVLLLFSVLQASAATPTQIAITDVTIIDVHDGSAKREMTVLISGNGITAVGPSKEIQIPKQIRVIDGRGRFLIPGLWDMHVHSDGDEHALRIMVGWGITGARDMAGDPAKLIEARRRISNQDWIGPRLVIAGPRLMGPPAEADEDVWIVHSPEDARHAVDSLARQHVDFIKVHDDLARDTYLAIASAAKANNLPFVGHVPASVTPAEASDLGQERGALPGASLHDEMALLVDAGFSSTEVLRAATLSPAVFLGLPDSLGTVERGMIANLVLLEANPIEDIHNTRRISVVLLEGRIVVDRSAR